jgi:hypothetical protein
LNKSLIDFPLLQECPPTVQGELGALMANCGTTQVGGYLAFCGGTFFVPALGQYCSKGDMWAGLRGK